LFLVIPATVSKVGELLFALKLNPISCIPKSDHRY
jgi:hypothetical protein